MASADSGPILVPFSADPLELLAETLIEDHRGSLPDLSNVTVLLAEPQSTPQLRRLLLDAAQRQGQSALLGPRIMSLREWALSFLPSNLQSCGVHEQSLILAEALLQQSALLGAASPWTLAEDLLKLFDELTANRIGLSEDLNDFTTKLGKAYGLDGGAMDALSREATLVHTLWRAWYTQLDANDQVDQQSAYLLALKRSLEQLPAVTTLYLAGFLDFSRAEYEWLQTLLQRQQIRLLLQGFNPEAAAASPIKRMLQILEITTPSSAHAGEPYSRCLNRVYQDAPTPLLERAGEFAQQQPQSPLEQRIEVFAATSTEEEAQAIELQVRRWLLAGKTRIGIVSENRRLSRRVRALLERADVPLQDSTGWALSTTSAAAALERWLECIEEDFAHLPLLDLLKSPFVFHDLERETVQLATHRLENDIILHENIARGLDRYRLHLKARSERLPDWLPETKPLLLEILTRLENAARPFADCVTHERQPAYRYLEKLLDSLTQLNMAAAFEADDAGSRLLQVLNQLQQASRKVGLSLSWQDFRSWLGRNLEQFNFRPPDTGSPVAIMGLAQSRLLCFDALILASAEREHLPGKPPASAFFNDAVRRELGLPTTTEHQAQRFHHFRRLLEAAPHVLITHRGEENGEPIPQSPWLERLQAFHELAWGSPLTTEDLHRLVKHPATRVVRCDTHELPPPPRQPLPRVPAANTPSRFSPSAYQQLLNCPYQYFAAHILKLTPPEEIRLALSKADYGERVHQCLHAFHASVEDLPGPFNKPLDKDTRTEAIALLNAITEAVFVQDVADNFEHRGWVQQWQKLIPKYIDWQIKRSEHWSIEKLEITSEGKLADSLKIHGRLDRLERSGQGRAILDYKTGAIPKKVDVQTGEYIQLPFYALLAADQQETVAQVGYLTLEKEKVNLAYTLEDDELVQLSHDISERLLQMQAQIREGHPLPAWPEDQSCRYCEMASLCRQQAWAEN